MESNSSGPFLTASTFGDDMDYIQTDVPGEKTQSARLAIMYTKEYGLVGGVPSSPH